MSKKNRIPAIVREVLRSVPAAAGKVVFEFSVREDRDILADAKCVRVVFEGGERIEALVWASAPDPYRNYTVLTAQCKVPGGSWEQVPNYRGDRKVAVEFLRAAARRFRAMLEAGGAESIDEVLAGFEAARWMATSLR